MKKAITVTAIGLVGALAAVAGEPRSVATAESTGFPANIQYVVQEAGTAQEGPLSASDSVEGDTVALGSVELGGSVVTHDFYIADWTQWRDEVTHVTLSPADVPEVVPAVGTFKEFRNGVVQVREYQHVVASADPETPGVAVPSQPVEDDFYTVNNGGQYAPNYFMRPGITYPDSRTVVVATPDERLAPLVENVAAELAIDPGELEAVMSTKEFDCGLPTPCLDRLDVVFHRSTRVPLYVDHSENGVLVGTMRVENATFTET